MNISNIYKEGELEEMSTNRKNRIVQNEGNRRVEWEVTFYNLEMITAIGYCVGSHEVKNNYWYFIENKLT